MSPTLSAEDRARLRRALESLLAEDTPRTRELRTAATELGVLPVTDDWHRDLGIRLADGKVVSFNRHQPYDLQVVTMPNVEIAVIGHAWTIFPELAPLVPTRSADAVECPACHGSGLNRQGERPSGFSCYCGGLGWLHRDGWTAHS